MSKKVFCILIVIIVQFLDVYPQPTWEKIKTPTDFNLLKVCYLDSLHCWVAGDSGVIMFSGDQGSSWTLQNSGVSNYISDIYFLNKNLGWAVTFEIEGSNSDIRSKVLKTSDGGGVWKNENYRHLNIILSTIFFKRPTKVFEDMVAGGRNAILSLPGVLPLEGGMPLIVKDQIIGAIGISGAKSNEDGIIAKAAVDFMSGL